MAETAPPPEVTLVFYLRPARRKARAVAAAEALGLLRGLSPSAPPGGPLSEQGGLFWIALPAPSLPPALTRLPRLGYTYAVDQLEPVAEPAADGAAAPSPRTVRWRKRLYRLVRVYEEDAAAARDSAPDRRVFLFETGDGVVRAVQGYRGDGRPLSRRGLPVYDARLLVNLTYPGAGGFFLDPYAGIGGVLSEAVAAGHSVASTDVDPALRHGLAQIARVHGVADARRLPFASGVFDAVATEPPYHREAEAIVRESLREMRRVLKTGGRLAVLCAAWQAGGLRREADALELTPYLDEPVNRKGLDVVVLAWVIDG